MPEFDSVMALCNASLGLLKEKTSEEVFLLITVGETVQLIMSKTVSHFLGPFRQGVLFKQ